MPSNRVLAIEAFSDALRSSDLSEVYEFKMDGLIFADAMEVVQSVKSVLNAKRKASQRLDNLARRVEDNESRWEDHNRTVVVKN